MLDYKTMIGDLEHIAGKIIPIGKQLCLFRKFHVAGEQYPALVALQHHHKRVVIILVLR